eukprot:403356856
MSENLKCGKCKKIYNTGRRLPIELPCSAKICKNRNACKKCVIQHILPSKAEDGSFTCCYSDQHTIASDFLFENDELAFNQVQDRAILTIKCMKHQDQYVEHYCHTCKELICIRCYHQHLQHINVQGGDSNFTPEKFMNYLLFVRPELEKISAQIKLSLKIFNKALSNDKEYYADQIVDRITKSFDLLKNIIPEKDKDKLHLHHPKHKSIITPDPQSMSIQTFEDEELKQDQFDLKSLMQRIRSLELKQLQSQDKYDKLSNINNQFFYKLTKERLKEAEDYQILKQNLENKLNTSLDEITRTTLERIEEEQKSIVALVNQSQQKQDKIIHYQNELTQNTLTQALEQFNENSRNLLTQEFKFKTYALENFKVINKELGKDISSSFFGRKDYDCQLFLDQLKLTEQLTKSFEFQHLVNCEIHKTKSSLLSGQISNFSTKQFKLLFKGSRDGFTATKFHELCDNKGPTVQFIQSEYGQVFGGYASIPLISPNNDFSSIQSDNDAFVFNLTKKSIHKQYRNQQNAVRQNKNCMGMFGGGVQIDRDFAICNNCDENRNSNSRLGWTYKLPHGYEYKSAEANSYLAGKEFFKVLEYEVYSFQ